MGCYSLVRIRFTKLSPVDLRVHNVFFMILFLLLCLVFLEVDGEVIERDLQPGEKLLVDPGHIAAMEDTVQFDIERVKGAKNILFGEGLFFARLQGPGKVWLQTMPISRLAEAIIPYIPKNNTQ